MRRTTDLATLDARTVEHLRDHGVDVREAAPLAGDVSRRRYHRLTLADGERVILASYPPDLREICERFRTTDQLLRAAGVRAPRIVLTLCDHGLMVVEDVGDATLYELRDRSWERLAPWFDHAAELIDRIARAPVDTVADLNPALDHALLSTELKRTWRLLCGDDGLLPGGLPERLSEALDQLVRRLADSPQSPCHRDFMARNLVPVQPQPELAVLDHQDLRLGPATYDIASLLNDSLFPPDELEESIVRARLPTAEERLEYHRAAAQRTLKAVGTFVGFARGGNSRHLPLVVPTLTRARAHLRRLPELEGSSGEVDTLWNDLRGALAARFGRDRIC